MSNFGLQAHCFSADEFSLDVVQLADLTLQGLLVHDSMWILSFPVMKITPLNDDVPELLRLIKHDQS